MDPFDIDREIEKLRKAYANREHLEVRQFTGKSVPTGITLVRVSWNETRYMRAGNIEARREVLWFSWAGDKFCGSSQQKKSAINIAQLYLDLEKETDMNTTWHPWPDEEGDGWESHAVQDDEVTWALLVTPAGAERWHWEAASAMVTGVDEESWTVEHEGETDSLEAAQAAALAAIS
jgi:hypothetical protein